MSLVIKEKCGVPIWKIVNIEIQTFRNLTFFKWVFTKIHQNPVAYEALPGYNVYTRSISFYYMD